MELTDWASEPSDAQHPTVGNGLPPQRNRGPTGRRYRPGYVGCCASFTYHERWAEGGRQSRGHRRTKRGPARGDAGLSGAVGRLSTSREILYLAAAQRGVGRGCVRVASGAGAGRGRSLRSAVAARRGHRGGAAGGGDSRTGAPGPLPGPRTRPKPPLPSPLPPPAQLRDQIDQPDPRLQWNLWQVVDLLSTWYLPSRLLFAASINAEIGNGLDISTYRATPFWAIFFAQLRRYALGQKIGTKLSKNITATNYLSLMWQKISVEKSWK